MYLVVFIATVSCALTCPRFEVVGKMLQTCPEHNADCCCGPSRGSADLNCVNASFIKQRDTHEPIIAVMPSAHTFGELTKINPSSQFLLVQMIPTKVVFQTYDILRI